MHSAFEDGYTAGGGARLGALVDPVPSWRIHVYARQLASLLGLRRDVALRLDLRREREAEKSLSSAALFVQVYF